MKIKLVLFDADGTLWNFINDKERIRRLNEAYLDTEVLKLLKILKNKRVSCKVLTYQNHKGRNYSKIKIKNWLKHFKILSYFDEVLISDKHQFTKEKLIRKVILINKIEKEEVMFIGDRYKWDYIPAKKLGIKAILLNKPENKKYKVKKYSYKEIISFF